MRRDPSTLDSQSQAEADAGWAELAAVLERRTGLVFAGARAELYEARVREHMETRRITAVGELVRLLRNSGVEFDELLDRLLAAPCGFLRAPEVFQAFSERVLPEMHLKKFWDQPRSLRVWSAGCGSGEEPYSIALSIAEVFDVAESWNIHLLATDISRQALQHAERGVYRRTALSELTPGQVENYFARAGEMFMVRPRLRNLVTFACANLADASYMGRFDCIFCIDVLDYFAHDHRAPLLQRFFEYLEPGGWLFLGRNDAMPELTVRFDAMVHRGVTLYQKPAAGAGRRFAAAGGAE